MVITYRLGDNLYVNVTNRCSNRCEFCVRNEGPGIGDSGDLWLEREPSVQETAREIIKNAGGCAEIVFCGYGEPLERLTEIIEICKIIKPKLGLPIRINTNGQADLIHDRETAPDLAGLVDTVSISLNAPDAQSYDRICHSDFGPAAFDAIIRYASACKKYVPNVVFSVVDVIGQPDIEKCRAISKKTGIPLRIREMIQ